MRWDEFERRQPAFAELGVRCLLEPGVLLIGTIRRDGTPRLSPVEPVVLDGELLLSMMWGSLKARDLLRDDRILVHSIVTNREGGDGEFKIRGRARQQNDITMQRRYAEEVARSLDWSPEPGQFHLFSVEVGTAAFLRYDGTTGDQYVASWPPAEEFVRRGTTATSVGPPEPRRELLVPET